MSVKDYKEGMVAGAKPFEEKFREIQNANIAALQKLCSENSNTIGELIDIAEEHDNLLNYDWKKNYELSSFAEKAIFLGFLKFCIRIIEGSDIPVDGQKIFFNNLCKTFQIDPFQIKEIEITKLKNNEDVSFQNLLYMSICNYFYISSENFKFEKKYNDDIFQYFRVSTNDKKEIHELIEWTNNHLSLESIFAYEDEQNTLIEEPENIIGCTSSDNLEDFTINELLFVKKDDEQIISNKRLAFNSNIKVDGKLLFKNCIINYGENDSIITIDSDGFVEFENCTFSYKHNITKYFIKADGSLKISNSLLVNCWSLCEKYGLVQIEKSNIIYNEEFNLKNEINNCECLLDCQSDIQDSYILGGSIVFAKDDFSLTYYSVFDSIKSCKQCTFKNCIHPDYRMGEIIDSKFYNCKNLINDCIFSVPLSIQNTEFYNCESIISLSYNSQKNSIQNSKFFDCSNCLIELKSSVLELKYCEFRNLKQDKNTSSYILISGPKNTDLIIQNTIFDNLTFTDYGYLIKIQGTMTEKEHCKINISDCMFGKVERRTNNPVIDSKIICVSYWISKQSSKKVLFSSNNTGINDLLKQIESQLNTTKINEIETIINEYLPKFGFRHFSKKDILQNKKAAKKFSVLKKLIPGLESENVLAFIDLSVTGNVNDHLVFTPEKCYYHSISTIWTYYYNHPEISSGRALLINNGERRVFNVDENYVKNKDFDECIRKLESILSV